MTSPTQLTLRECSRCLWPAAVVEKWIPGANIRRDLFGAIDIVALDELPGVRGIQATSDSNVAARVTKLRSMLPGPLGIWLARGNRLEVWGWRKVDRRWRARIVKIELS